MMSVTDNDIQIMSHAVAEAYVGIERQLSIYDERVRWAYIATAFSTGADSLIEDLEGNERLMIPAIKQMQSIDFFYKLYNVANKEYETKQQRHDTIVKFVVEHFEKATQNETENSTN